MTNVIGFSLAVLVFLLLAFFWLDRAFFRFAQRHQLRPLVAAFFQLFSSRFFVGVLFFILPSIPLVTAARLEDAARIYFASALALVLTFILKTIFGRTRPLGQRNLLGRIDSSFPSAHTAGSFAPAFVVATLFPQVETLVIVLASFVAISRLHLSMHFLSDIFGGLLLAYFSVYFILSWQFVLPF